VIGEVPGAPEVVAERATTASWDDTTVREWLDTWAAHLEIRERRGEQWSFDFKITFQIGRWWRRNVTGKAVTRLL
jgi:hypothetical protein